MNRASAKSFGLSILKWITSYMIVGVASIGLLWWMMHKKPDVKDDSTLFIELDRPLIEANLPTSPWLNFVSNRRKQLSVQELIYAIRTAAKDQRITRMVINLDRLAPDGMQTVQELGKAIGEFRATGKPVVAYSANYGRPELLLASNASQRWMHDMGHADLAGPEFGILYFGDLLKKLGIDVTVVKAGKYKSAAEPMVSAKMSDAAREEYQTLTDGQRASFFQDISANAKAKMDIGPDTPGMTAQQALQHHIVNKLVAPIDVENFSYGDADSKTPARKRPDNRIVAIDTWMRAMPEQQCPAKEREGNKGGLIAVVTLSGSIGMDGDPLSSITPPATINMLRQLRLNDKTAAVVLRIDSPGGDAQAAEMIREEIVILRASGIPVIASLANTAASGGYWIASAANEIWSGQYTMTGSIGAFAMLPSVAKAATHYDINPQIVRSGPDPLYPRILENPTDAQKQWLKGDIDNLYEKFLRIVGDARKMNRDQVDAIAQGRVWTGPQAMERGLVDHIGTLDDAINSAAKQGNTSPECARSLPPELSVERMVDVLARSYTSAMIPQIPGIPATVSRTAANLSSFVEANAGKPIVYCLQCSGAKP